MMLLLILSPMGSHQVHRRHRVEVIYKFFERSAVPQVESVIDQRTNIFGASYK